MTVALAVLPDVTPAAPGLQRPPARGLLLGGTLTAVGLLLVGFVVHLAVLSRLSEGRDQAVLRGQFRDQVRKGTAPVTLPLPDGRPIAVLQVPRLGIDALVVQGTTGADLAHGPGHRASSPLPGQAGIAVVAGRRSAYGGPFAHLDRLRIGDLLTTTTGFGKATFRVDDVRHNGAPLTLPPGDGRLQLVTSDPAWTPQHALVVSAVMVDGQLQPAASGLPAPTAQEFALLGDPRAAVPVVVWAALLLSLSVLLAWGWQRLCRPVVWIGGAPAALAVLWQLADALARLLPSTL
ncbi:MAG: peptidase sortase [Frankiales bacterium]|nr:peptidase sortase [Frankiales bacterium]